MRLHSEIQAIADNWRFSADDSAVCTGYLFFRTLDMQCPKYRIADRHFRPLVTIGRTETQTNIGSGFGRPQLQTFGSPSLNVVNVKTEANPFVIEGSGVRGEAQVVGDFFVEEVEDRFEFVAKNVRYSPQPGRDSLFVALLFFVSHVKDEHYGYLGPLNLGGKNIDLLSVLTKSKSK